VKSAKNEKGFEKRVLKDSRKREKGKGRKREGER
jgi:hypothetical protein